MIYKPKSREARGYGYAHRQLRLQYAPLVKAGMVTCCRCGEWIQPSEPWDLDHSEDRTAYLGPSHQHCNRSAGARKRKGNAPSEPRRSRAW